MSSAFLNLPAELRNQIYELVAASIPKVKIEYGKLTVPHSLLATCQQTRKERRQSSVTTLPSQQPKFAPTSSTSTSPAQ